MKKLFIALLCACLCATSFAQPRFGHPQNYKHHSSHEDRYYEEFQDNNRPDAIFKMFHTTVPSVLLKLDTRDGRVKKIYLRDDSFFTREDTVQPFSEARGKEAFPGRFNIIRSRDMQSYVLMDTVDGRTWLITVHSDGNVKCNTLNSLGDF